jgi:hypothetical protein
LTGTVHRVIDGNNTGTVINQSIAPGTVVAIGSALDLAISSNLMPDVVGELIQTAQAVVAAAGLDLDENFAEQHSSSFGVGEVIHQSPAADSVVSPGSDVSLTISLGAESVDSGGGFDFGFGFGFFRGAGASGEFLLTEAGDILVTEAGDRLLLEEALDDVPEAFVFTDQVDVARSSTITSSAITVTGINTLAAISVSGGTYDINSSGSFTSSPGTVSNGDTVRARVASSGSFSTAVSATVTIGGVSDTFTATTLASSGLSAPGVTGEIVADGSISIAYDGSHGFGAQGPTTILYDDGRNYGTVGTTIVSGNPLIGTYDSQDIEGLVSASGRNQTNGKGLLATYITSAERNTSGGARQNAVLLGGNKTEFYYSRALRWVQKGTYSGSFLKMAWLFDGTTAGAGGVWDIVLPTFYNGQNGVGYLGNNNGGQWTFGSIDNNSSAPDFVWNTYVDDTGGWNIFECWLKLGATSASDKMQFRLTSSKGVYDSGIITKAVSTSGTRRFGCLTAPFGWHGDTGGDTRVQNNDEVVASEQYMTAGAGSAARVMIGNASTLAACTDLTPWTIDLWSNTGIDCTVRDGPFADLDGKYIYVFDENSALVLNGSDESRLIS